MQAATDLTFILHELSRQRATGRLTVRLPGALASVYFKVGDVIHATLGVTKGSEALSLILQATPQSSEFRANLSAPETTIQGSLELFLRRPESSPPLPDVAVPVDPQDATTLQPRPHEVTKTVQVVQPLQPREVVPTAFINDLANALVDVMGPIGTIVLEDAQADLGLEGDIPKSELQALITEIVQQLKTPLRQQPFQQKVDVLLGRYGLN